MELSESRYVGNKLFKFIRYYHIAGVLPGFHTEPGYIGFRLPRYEVGWWVPMFVLILSR